MARTIICYVIGGVGLTSVLWFMSTLWLFADKYSAVPPEVSVQSIFDFDTTIDELPVLTQIPASTWVVVSKIRHCRSDLTEEEHAAVASWQLLRPEPTVVLMDECPDTPPRTPANILMATHVQFATMPLLTFGKVRFAVKHAGADLPSFRALAWVDIRFVFDNASAAELSNLVSPWTSRTRLNDNLSNLNAVPQPSLVTIRNGWHSTVPRATHFKLEETPPETPATFGLDAVGEGRNGGGQHKLCAVISLNHCHECDAKDGMGNVQCTVCKHHTYLSRGKCKAICSSPQIGYGTGKYHRYCGIPRFMLWTTPDSRLWVPWVAVHGEEFVSDDDDVGWVPSWTQDQTHPTNVLTNDTKRNRCRIKTLTDCDECERNDAFGNTECTSCKHSQFLSHGKCKSKCVSPQIGFGSGKYHRYCAVPNARVLTTVATTTVAPLPSVMPEFAVVVEQSDRTAGIPTERQLESVLLFTIDPTDGVADVTAFSHKSLSDYCARWSCRTHFISSHYASAKRRVTGFEQYQTFLELFNDKRFASVTTFVYIACGGAIVRPSTDISLYAPQNGSEFDVLFGNMGLAENAGRPSTAYIAARRSSTALELFSQLAKMECTDRCEKARRPSTEKLDECCVNILSALFNGAVACISEQTPAQLFSSWTYAKVAMEERPQPFILQCRGHSCAEHRAVIEPVIEPGATKCDWRRSPRACTAASTVHALREASARETWQMCSTYVFNGTLCAAAGESPEDFARHSYTIVISTFARDDALLSNLPHWLACNNVSAVLVVWHNPNREVVPKLRRLGKVYKRLTVLQQETDQLSNRYLKGYGFKTDAIFSVDDDEWYSSAILQTAFEVWQRNAGEAMVGFSPRRINYSHDSGNGIGYVYDGVCKPSMGKFGQKLWKEGPCGHYNTLFVTKGGFLHKRFYRAYFEPTWDAPRAAVDKWSTAEDILMATVHASLAKPTSLPSTPQADNHRHHRHHHRATLNTTVIAVTAHRRHDSDYRGTLSFDELQYQGEGLKRDPNSLHFKSEMNRGRTRMEIIRNMAEMGLPSPKDHSVWYSVEQQQYIHAEQLCTIDGGRGCYIF